MDLDKKQAGVLGILAVLLVVIVVAGMNFQPGTIVESSQVDEITFYHVTDGAYAYENLQDNFDENYAGVHGDVAMIGAYTFDSTQYYNISGRDGCGMNPKATRNGETLDSYSLNNDIEQYPSQSQYDSTPNDQRKEDYGEISAWYGAPYYLYADVYWGYYLGLERCYGPMNRYTMQVPFDEISAKVETPGNITEGEPLEATVRFENGWRQLKANLSAEVCVRESFCKTVDRNNIEVPPGSVSIDLVAASAEETNATGEMRVDLSGTIGLDLSDMKTQNVVVECNGEGSKENASECVSVKIGEISGEGVTTVLERPEEPPSNEGLGTLISKIITRIIQFLTFEG